MKNQSGNVLFLILIAVALFAALSYAVTQSSRGGGGNANEEVFRTEIARIDSFQASMRAALTRMRVIGSVDPENIDFRAYQGTTGDVWYRNNALPMRSTNSNCGDDTCRVFHTNGGGVIPIILDEAVVGEPFTASNTARLRHGVVDASRVAGFGSDAHDIIVQFFRIQDDFCEAFNEQRGISGIPADDRGDYIGIGGSFSFVDNGAFGYGDEATELAGQDSFCVNSVDEGNTIVLVLLER